MPKHKQPIRLEDMALRRSIVWLCNIGEELMPVMESISKNDPQEAADYIKMIVSNLHDIFEYSVPWDLYDNLSLQLFAKIAELIEKIRKALDIRASMATFLAQVNVAISLSEVLLSHKLRKLKFEDMTKMMRHIFYKRMNLLTGLEYLDLGSMSGGWKTFDMEGTILKGTQTMKNLTGLTLNYDCTDNVLRHLCKYCPKIQYLDISNSKYVTNESIDILVGLKKLNVVFMHRTQVTLAGMIDLLLKVPNVTDVGKYDDLGRILEFIDDSYPEKTFKLKKFVTRYATTRHLQILAEKCPDMEHISIFHNMLLIDIMALIGINKMAELKLMACDFFGDQIRNVLEVKGCNLTQLHLEHVEQIDMNALMYISQFCPDLKTLTLYNCVLIQSTSLYTKKLPLPPYMNLEKLTFVCQSTQQHLDFILAEAFKIREILLGSTVYTDDLMFERLFLRNPFQYLESLRIMNSEEMTIATAYRFVDNCASMVLLNELECWKKIKPDEIAGLKLYIKERNYAVDVAPLRRYQQ